MCVNSQRFLCSQNQCLNGSIEVHILNVLFHDKSQLSKLILFSVILLRIKTTNLEKKSNLPILLQTNK